MRVVVTGGGTGGHIYPALVIADAFKKYGKAEILYIGSRDGMEINIVESHGYEIKTISAFPFYRHRLSLMGKTFFRNLKGMGQAKKILRDFKPDIVIGTGGYVTMAVMLSAQKLGIPTYLHEQNAFPGKVNKLVGKKSRIAFLGFAEARERLGFNTKTITVGNPVRESFGSLRREDCKRALGYDTKDFVVLTVGGSYGAQDLNSVVVELCKKIDVQSKIKIVFATGERFYSQIVDELGSLKYDNVKVISYIKDMNLYLTAADLVISRAGALSLAEEAAVGRAAILVPFPMASENHQFYNAKSVADEGAAILIEEKDLTADALLEKIKALEGDRKKIAQMEDAAKSLGKLGVSHKIYEEIMKDFNRR